MSLDKYPTRTQGYSEQVEQFILQNGISDPIFRIIIKLDLIINEVKKVKRKGNDCSRSLYGR